MFTGTSNVVRSTVRPKVEDISDDVLHAAQNTKSPTGESISKSVNPHTPRKNNEVSDNGYYKPDDYPFITRRSVYEHIL